jgi:thiamine-phosphate pyrophosphorylase
MNTENNHEEFELNKKELKWKKNALDLAEAMIEKFSDFPDESYSARSLDSVFGNMMQLSWFKRPKKFIINTGIGYALGQCLVDALGFEWIVYKDYLGKDVALKHPASGLICFPVSSVRKRLKDKNYCFMADYLEEIKGQILDIARELPQLHFVSQGLMPEDHLDSIDSALKSGCRWVQLRLKDTDFQTYLNTALSAREICNKYNAKLTINDNPQIALRSKADGLHLGKNDMSPSDARIIVGDIIIGGTANTWEDVLELVSQNVNYIGLGPFRFTYTKKNLSPVLGIEGYDNIIQKMKTENIDIPLFAIGGIEQKDIPFILDVGVYGIAVSGLIHNAGDKTAVCKAVNDCFNVKV